MTDSPKPKRSRSNNNVDGNNDPACSVVNSCNATLFSINDDCLLHIFKMLDIDSFCNMADICLRFKNIALQVFPKRFEHFEFESGTYKKSTFHRVLHNFGHLIKSIDTENFHSRSDWAARAMAKYCKRGPLEKLILHRMKINCNVVKPMISRLKELHLDCCRFTGNTKDLLTDCFQLELLYFDPVENPEFAAQIFPQLKSLIFDGRERITLTRLLSLNPQINKLHAMCSAEDSIIMLITRHLRFVEHLTIKPGFLSSRPERQTPDGLLLLRKLKSLKYLSLDACEENYSIWASPLLKAFNANKMTLETLHLSNFSIKPKDIISIHNLKTLKILSLHDIEVATVDNFIDLVEALPLLEELKLQFDYYARVKIASVDLENVIRFAGKLTYLGIAQVRRFTIDQNVYESLLEVVLSREEIKKITISICGCITTNGSDVPYNIQQENKTFLNIKFESWSCPCVGCIDTDTEDSD